MTEPVRMTEEQWQALKEWVQAVATEAAADDSDDWSGQAAMYVSHKEDEAREAFNVDD